MKSISNATKTILAAAALAICTSVPTSADVMLVASHIYEDQGLWGWTLHRFEDSGPIDDITSLQINLPIANEGVTGGWKAWGPVWGDGSSVSDWTVEFGDWQSSPKMSYVKWIAPVGTSLVPPSEPPSFYFFLQVPPIFGSESIGKAYLTDSLGNVHERGIGGVPILTPEPSSLVALAGLASIGGFVLRRRAK